jgi:hypothetical protein
MGIDPGWRLPSNESLHLRKANTGITCAACLFSWDFMFSPSLANRWADFTT